VHMNDGTSIEFRPMRNGLWVHHIDNVQHEQNMWSMLSTVSNKKQLYTKRAYKHAVMEHRLQNIIMRPSMQKYQDLIIDHMGDCPVTWADIQAAEDISGPNLGSIKGKTVWRPNPCVAMGVDPIPQEILSIYRDVTISIDITFVSKVLFCITVSHSIKFGMVEMLLNQQVKTVKKCMDKVANLYIKEAFRLQQSFLTISLNHYTSGIHSLMCALLTSTSLKSSNISGP
jgi:hypothetical protein